MAVFVVQKICPGRRLSVGLGRRRAGRRCRSRRAVNVRWQRRAWLNLPKGSRIDAENDGYRVAPPILRGFVVYVGWVEAFCADTHRFCAAVAWDSDDGYRVAPPILQDSVYVEARSGSDLNRDRSLGAGSIRSYRFLYSPSINPLSSNSLMMLMSTKSSGFAERTLGSFSPSSARASLTASSDG